MDKITTNTREGLQPIRPRGKAALVLAGGVMIQAPNGEIIVGVINTTNNARLSAGRGGDVTLTAGSHMQVFGNVSSFGLVNNGGIHAGGGHMSLTSVSGNVAFNGTINSGIGTGNAVTTTGAAGDVTITAVNGQISTGSTSLFAYNASSNPASSMNTGGNVTLMAGTGFAFPPTFDIRTESFSAGQVSGPGGDVTVTTMAGDIQFRNIWTHNRAAVGDVYGSGAITLHTNNGGVQLGNDPSATAASAYALANTGDVLGNSGSVVITATQGITSVGQIQNYAEAGATGSLVNNSGNISLFTGGGDISVNFTSNRLLGRDSSGNVGDVRFDAPNGAITVNGLIDGRNNAPNFNGQAGRSATVILTALGDIETGAINVGGFVGSGGAHAGAGHIHLQTPAEIRTANLTANLAIATTGSGGHIALSGDRVRVNGLVQAIGLSGTGGITITHGGNGAVPFVVGDAAVNGSTGQLRTTNAVINPTQSFLFTHFQPPNIRIISIDQPITGLTATNDSPTPLDQTTNFTVTATTGNNLTFVWDFGDGGNGVGANPAHLYGATGTYTATVIASNDNDDGDCCQ